MNEILERFKKGFEGDWQVYHDRKLNKETIMRSTCESANERLFNGRKRYKLKNG